MTRPGSSDIAALSGIIRDTAMRYIGRIDDTDTYTLLCPAHNHPDLLFDAVAEALSEALYRRSLWGRTSERWFWICRRLPHGLIRLLSARQRRNG